MGKPPKKRNLSDKVRKSKTSAEIKNNPFEVKINRKKFDILGRKSKHDVGLPGVSRSKAINKRKETLLKEYKQKNKSSKFIDKRLGEYDSKMDPEEKILQRFTVERQRVHEKKDLYNLNEDEELTHFGQSLAEMEKFNDAVNSDDEAEERGLLSAELTASHFGGGGGLLRRKTSGEQEEGGLRARSRQELIEELIQKSKQEKRERQVQKEESQELTEKLDQDWKSIQALMVKKTPRAEQVDKPEEKPKLEEYDMMVRELGFEMKAQPSEKMKTPEELAREEQERLQRLEADRLRRMLGDEGADAPRSQAYASADDLNDGFILDKDDEKTLAYQDGKWNIGEESEGDEDENGEEGESGDEEEEDDSGDDDDDDGEEEGDEEAEEDASSGEEDGHSDLDSERDSEDEERTVDEEDGTKAEPGLTKEELKLQQEAAKAELPYTFTAPESYGDLKELLRGHTPDNQRLVVARTQKSNHPSLAVGNKLKLQKLFGFLLEYMGEISTRSPPQLTTVDKLIPELYGLCQMFPQAACQEMQRVLGDAAHGMEEELELKGCAAFPTLDMIIYLKVTQVLFPTSDFRHPVTTPALLYISQALCKCPVRSLQDLTSGLVLCSLAVEYVSLSKRFIPELINFLTGTLYLAVKDKSSPGHAAVPPFRPTGKHSDLLVLTDPESCESWSEKSTPLAATQQLELSSDLDRDQHRFGEGYRLQFRRWPPPPSGVRETSVRDPGRALCLSQEIAKLFDKKAITRVHPRTQSSGFYSTYFLIPKKDTSLRPVLDLRGLNQYQWFNSIDLKDAYFHVPIHPDHRQFLHFAFQGHAYQFAVLPFGLSQAPRIFTRCMRGGLGIAMPVEGEDYPISGRLAYMRPLIPGDGADDIQGLCTYRGSGHVGELGEELVASYTADHLHRPVPRFFIDAGTPYCRAGGADSRPATVFPPLDEVARPHMAPTAGDAVGGLGCDTSGAVAPAPPADVVQQPPDGPSPSQGEIIRSQGPPGGAQVALEDLVLHAPQPVGRGALAAPSTVGPPVPAGLGGVASLSEPPSTLGLAVEGGGSFLTDLEPSVWTWGFDPVSCPLQVVLRYLQYLFDACRAASTLKVHVAVISVHHGHIDGRPVGAHYWVAQFLWGARRLRPPRLQRAAAWDLPLVLQALGVAPFEPMAGGSLGTTSWKTAFLLAITSVKRVSELHALSSRLEERANLLCPVRALWLYLQATQSFRRSEQLFVCYRGAHKGRALSKQRLSHWIVDTIKQAYDVAGRPAPSGVVCHSTTSWAAMKGVALSEIFAAASWTGPCTFSRFYRLNAASGPTLALAVLPLASAADH
ncbi:LOW QUALITY PROTEIN: nucleolar protein 14 [Cololabis saira]|uniref:LOW QUALITY PROTEIN: nucleolar protein 14 n=1 Tax=Cololabis saira TaxID=129043 RepID=UPI002AD3F738|nr:LOW QUALITY PROTEIN: nucleolar protein 14 [Cololabis saira]